MSDYIKRGKFVELITNRDLRTINTKTIGECLDKAEASADVVEVVRCKDCEYYRDSFGETYCDLTRGHVKVNDYCSYGEREDQGNEE